MLNASAVLSAGWWLVVINRKATGVEVCRLDRLEGGCGTGLKQSTRILQCHAAHAGIQTEWNVRTGIVHVIALNAFVHDAKSAANDCLATTGQVVSKAEPRTEGRPVVVHESPGYAVLSSDADSVQVQRNTRQGPTRRGA